MLEQSIYTQSFYVSCATTRSGLLTANELDLGLAIG